MKRINPLYIILLFLVLTLISFFVLQNKSKQLNSIFREYQNIQQKAKIYKSLKSRWLNKDFINQEIQKISSSSRFKSENISVTNDKNKIGVTIQSDNPKILEAFLNKILNSPLIIEKIDIKQKNISLEIGVK